MATTQITVRIPNSIFVRLSDRAEASGRRVIDELRDLLARALNDDVMGERIASLETCVAGLAAKIDALDVVEAA